MPESARVAAREQDPGAPCGRDEVREYFCDDLLPLSSARPAPEPYDNCPGTTNVRPGAFPAIGRVAGFDKSFTEYTRRRTPPGHSCCYSWCSNLAVVDASKAGPLACADSNGLRENFCMREAEGGVSQPISSAFERCPAAVKPPDAQSFSAPGAAQFDQVATADRRQQSKLAECCYGWCSKAPAGTVLSHKHQPKIK